MGKVVTTTDETSVGCALVVAGEGAVGVGGALSGLKWLHGLKADSRMKNRTGNPPLTLIMTKRAPEA